MSKQVQATERKSIPAFSTKVLDEDEGIVEHIFAVFGNIDQGNDVLHPGSFSKSITERGGKIKVLDLHNINSIMNIVGKPMEMREIGKDELPRDLLEAYPEASGGVMAKTKFFLETPEGKGAFVRIKEGAIDNWSFGFDALDVDYETVKSGEKNLKVRNIRTLKLYEYSPVLWGMNPATTTLSSKSEEKEEDKDESLHNRIEKISAAFLLFFDGANKDDFPQYWVTDVYEDHLIVSESDAVGNTKFSVTFSENDDIIHFASREDWIEGKFEFVPTPEENVDEVIPQAEIMAGSEPPPTKSDDELLKDIELEVLELAQL